MKIGDNIREIREKEAILKRDDVALALGISTKAYSNIESNIADVTITRLHELAEIFNCSPEYILSYQKKSSGFINHFNNYEGNKGVNIMYQGCTSEDIKNLENQINKSKEEAIRLKGFIQGGDKN